MKTVAILMAVLVLALAGCGGGEPELSETFRASIDDFIAAGSTLHAATGQGVVYADYRGYVAEAAGAYDIALATWPDGFAPDAREQFAQALTGWRLAGAMWDAHINDELIPSDDPRTTELDRYGGDYLRKVGQRYAVSEENIGALLRLAGDQFAAGRDSLLPLLP